MGCGCSRPAKDLDAELCATERKLLATKKRELVQVPYWDCPEESSAQYVDHLKKMLSILYKKSDTERPFLVLVLNSKNDNIPWFVESLYKKLTDAGVLCTLCLTDSRQLLHNDLKKQTDYPFASYDDAIAYRDAQIRYCQDIFARSFRSKFPRVRHIFSSDPRPFCTEKRTPSTQSSASTSEDRYAENSLTASCFSEDVPHNCDHHRMDPVDALHLLLGCPNRYVVSEFLANGPPSLTPFVSCHLGGVPIRISCTCGTHLASTDILISTCMTRDHDTIVETIQRFYAHF